MVDSPERDDPEVIGVTAADELPNAEEVLKRMSHNFRVHREAQIRRRNQSIRFSGERPICITFVADNHIGNVGTDYDRMIAEARLIAETENMYVIQVGDLVDNFIVGKLLGLRIGTKISIPEEWVVADYYLRLLGTKILGVCGGNHDKWTLAVSGIDQLQSMLRNIRKDVLYDTDELLLTIQVGELIVPTRIRHKWRYSSILNPTHGIERAFERDQAKRFMLGVGAHTHVSGLARQFNGGGSTGLAVICGSYKVYDDFAHTQGFTQPNGSTAIAVVFHPKNGMIGFDNLELAAEYMKVF